MTAILTLPDGRTAALTKLSYAGRQLLPPPPGLLLAVADLSPTALPAVIEKWSGQIAISAIMMAADEPRSRRGGSEAEKRELADLVQAKKTLGRLRVQFRSMHSELISRIEDANADARHPLLLADDIAAIEAHISAHLASMEKSSEEARDSAPQSSAKIAPLEIARMCRSAFERLRAEPAKIRNKAGVAYGPFLDFVRAVFDALNVDSSAEYYARIASMENAHKK